MNEKNTLSNRYLHINRQVSEEKVDIENSKVDIGSAKVDIGAAKVDIGAAKMDIENLEADDQALKADFERLISTQVHAFSAKTMVHIYRLFDKFGFEGIFGRGMVMDLLGLKASGASKLLSGMLRAGLIEPVSGHGKGKYRFK